MAESFDDRAAEWDDDPRRLQRARAVAERIREVAPLSPTMSVLDYGAGTGLLSQMLAEDVGPITLADPSAGMRQVAEAKAAAGLFGPGAWVVDLDLARDEPPQDRYDLIVSLMALHHVDDVPRALAGLRTMLSESGVLCLVDLEHDHDRSFHSEDFEGHHGFERAELEELLHAAGFADVDFHHAYAMPKNDRTYDLFLAMAR